MVEWLQNTQNFFTSLPKNDYIPDWLGMATLLITQIWGIFMLVWKTGKLTISTVWKCCSRVKSFFPAQKIHTSCQRVLSHLEDPQATWMEKEEVLLAGPLHVKLKSTQVEYVHSGKLPTGENYDVMVDLTKAEKKLVNKKVVEAIDRVVERDRQDRLATVPAPYQPQPAFQPACSAASDAKAFLTSK